MSFERQWKEINFIKGYSISNDGIIYSHKKEKCLSVYFVKGYKRISLSVNKIRRGYLVHKIVAEHFIGIAPENMEINHKDGNKLNNNVDNLEYVTRSQNMIHREKLGLIKHLKGESHHFSKLKKSNVEVIRKLNGKVKSRLIYEYFNISKNTFYDIIKFKTWRN